MPPARTPSISLTELLAAYGAILSSVGFGWNLYRDLLDRPNLKVSAHVRRIGVGADRKWFAVTPNLNIQGASEQLYVVLSLVNVGRRPVLWQGWGGKYHKPEDGKSAFFIVGRYLPKMIQEGETHSEFTELEANLKPANDNVKSLFMWDPSGKHWRLPRRELKELKKEAVEFGGDMAAQM